ncbi:MAG: polysaccharide lyase [Planctomycetaceae bacterium]
MRITTFLLTVCVWFASLRVLPNAHAGGPSDWFEGTPGRDDGATRDYYNRDARLAWRNQLGDWHDTEGKPQGDNAFGTTTLSRSDLQRPARMDVTSLVRLWRGDGQRNQGMLIRRLSGGCDFHFHSRECEVSQDRPRLVLETDAGKLALEAEADTYTEPSTYRCMGSADTLRVGGRNHTLIRFDLSGIAAGTDIRTAALELSIKAVYGEGETVLGAFRCSQGHDELPSEPQPGLAATFPRDRGIEDHADVIFFTDFESPSWMEQWSHAGREGMIDTVASDAPRKFQPLQGKALRARIAEGEHEALNTLYRFREETGDEPEEIYFRYYLRLADDWNQTIEGGKMPGISGTYGRSGWGGRKSDGTTGWSARGTFFLTLPKSNPLGGLHPIGTYCYHADMQGQYGDIWLWQKGYRGYLEKNRWYAVEQYLKLNNPSKKDGVLRAWVDGRPAFEKTDIRFRVNDQLKIEQVWMNLYHGGSRPSPHDQHLFIDHVVIAKRYIGLMGSE